MSFLIRAVYQLPYYPGPHHVDLISNLVTAKRWSRLVTGARVVSVLQGYGDQQTGLAAAQAFGVGLQQILDCDIQAKVVATELGAKQEESLEFLRRKKADAKPVRRFINGLQLRLSFSASYSPNGSKGEFALVCDGEKVACEKGFELPLATNVHEACYDALDCGLVRTIEYCKSCNIEMALEAIALVSPSQHVIRQLRGEWKIDSASLVDRAVLCQKLLSNFDRSRLSFHLPAELALPLTA